MFCNIKTVHSFCRAQNGRANLVIGECQKYRIAFFRINGKTIFIGVWPACKCHFGQKVKYEVINTRHNHERCCFWVFTALSLKGMQNLWQWAIAGINGGAGTQTLWNKNRMAARERVFKSNLF
jgi:hypothetical protein